MIYRKGQYVYPPRPENKIRPNLLASWERKNMYMAQPKLNGSCCEIYLNNKHFDAKNRHASDLTNFKINKQTILKLHRGYGEMLLVGEYMNKSQRNENNILFNNKFVIFDILVYNNNHLLGMTFQDRYDLLLELYDVKEYDDYIYEINSDIYLVKSFHNDFDNIYKKMTKIQMYEGWVLKPKENKLKPGSRPKNNLCVKCRKETKNYQF